MRSRLEGQLREDNSPRGRIQNGTHIYHIHHHDHSPNHDHTPSEYLPHTHSSDDLLRNRNDHTHYYDHLLLAAKIVLLLFCLIYLAFLHDGVLTNQIHIFNTHCSGIICCYEFCIFGLCFKSKNACQGSIIHRSHIFGVILAINTPLSSRTPTP